MDKVLISEVLVTTPRYKGTPTGRQRWQNAPFVLFPTTAKLMVPEGPIAINDSHIPIRGANLDLLGLVGHLVLVMASNDPFTANSSSRNDQLHQKIRGRLQNRVWERLSVSVGRNHPQFDGSCNL